MQTPVSAAEKGEDDIHTENVKSLAYIEHYDTHNYDNIIITYSMMCMRSLL